MATANLADMAVLSGDATFGGRVLMAVVQYCTITVPGEAVASTANACQTHMSRKNYASLVLNNPNFYKPLFINAVAANQIVANDATTNGSIATLTSSAVPAQAALCTDSDINNAVAAAFNAFISTI